MKTSTNDFAQGAAVSVSGNSFATKAQAVSSNSFAERTFQVAADAVWSGPNLSHGNFDNEFFFGLKEHGGVTHFQTINQPTISRSA